jgi:hypothetical protein
VGFVSPWESEVDRTDLRRLKQEDPETFRRYAATDAEIVLEAFLAFRAQVRHRWGVDPLMYPSLASLTAAAFRYGFLTSTPAPVKHEEETYSRKMKRGFTEATRKVPRFAGEREVRIAALRASHGGRVEVFVRGFYVAPLVERDVVSLYPSAARLQPLPNAKTQWRRVKSLEEVRELEGVGRFQFRFPKGTRYPVLPVKGKSLLYPLSGVSDATFAEPAPVPWTPQMSRNRGRMCPWSEGRGGSSIPSSGPMRSSGCARVPRACPR